MKPLLCLLTLVLCVARAADPKPVVAPHPLTLTFYIAGVQNDQDAATILESLKTVKSVTKVEGFTTTSGYANISWDSHVNGYHEVAQAIADTKSSGGAPFVPTMKLRVPDYAKADHAPKIDAIFAKYKQLVTVEPLDREAGIFLIRFLPLKPDPARAGRPQGWSGGFFGHPIHDAPPAGLGLAVAFVQERSATPKPVQK